MRTKEDGLLLLGLMRGFLLVVKAFSMMFGDCAIGCTRVRQDLEVSDSVFSIGIYIYCSGKEVPISKCLVEIP